MESINQAAARMQQHPNFERVMAFVNWFQRVTAGVNWYRMAFIFLPAIIRGDIKSIGLYLPFMFGYLLRRLVDQWSNLFAMKDNITVNLKISRGEYISWAYRQIRELILVVGFLGVCHYMQSETRFLVNFFLSSFIVPMIRLCFPAPHKGPLKDGKPMWDTTWGDTLVHVFVAVGLCLSWWLQGMDQLFLGFLFLLAIPTIQERFWLKPTQHMYLVLAILAACLPFFSVGITSRFFPSYLEYFPKPYLQVLCVLSNAVPKVKDYYSVLGVSPDSDMKTIKRVFREMAIELHPDKVGDDPVLLHRFHQIREASDALTKGRAKYDAEIENQELHEMAPRCEAFMTMMYFWLLYALIDWVQIEDSMIATKTELKNYILKDRRLDMDALGLPDDDDGRQVLKDFCETKDVENVLPYVRTRGGTREEIMELRDLLIGNKSNIQPYPEVSGKIKALKQMIALENAPKKGGGVESLLKNASGFYDGWTITVEGTDVLTGASKKATSVIEKHELVSSGDVGHNLVTLETELGFEPEMGTSRCSLAPPKGKDAEPVKALVGFAVYHSLLQVIALGEGEKNDEYAWKLSDLDNQYAGYRIEVSTGKTYVGASRVQEYNAKTRTVRLKGPLTLTDPAVRPVPGESIYRMFPDQLIPQENFAPASLYM